MSQIGYGAFQMLVGFPKTPYVFGSMTKEEMNTIMGLCYAWKPKVFAEIGIDVGKTSKGILDNAPWIERYIGVDVNPDAGSFVRGCSRFNFYLLGLGKTLDPKDIQEADMVFIDADHSYDHVKQDTEIAREAMGDKPAIIVWHDYNFPEIGEGVTRYIDECNTRDGDRICHVIGTHVCFEVMNMRTTLSFQSW